MERNVTRTIEKRTYTALIYDVEKKETLSLDYVLTDKIKDNDDALKILRKRYESPAYKFCAVTGSTVEEQLYALSEVEFLKAAHPAEDKESGERYVTRTIQKKVYVTLVYNNESKETITTEFILTERVKDNEEALKLLRKRYEGATLNVCAILDTKIEERTYALAESEFIRLAHIVSK